MSKVETLLKAAPWITALDNKMLIAIIRNAFIIIIIIITIIIIIIIINILLTDYSS